MPKEVRILDFTDSRQRMAAVEEIVSAKAGLYEWTFHPRRNRRSLNQNAWYWGCILPAVAAGMAEAWGERVTADEAHEFLKEQFLKRPIVNRNTGVLQGYTMPSTAALDTAAFTEFVDNIIKFAGEFLGVEIPPPAHMETVNV